MRQIVDANKKQGFCFEVYSKAFLTQMGCALAAPDQAKRREVACLDDAALTRDRFVRGCVCVSIVTIDDRSLAAADGWAAWTPCGAQVEEARAVVHIRD